MSSPSNVRSQVLIHDQNPTALAALRQFCNDNFLVGIEDRSASLSDLLSQHIDLGGLFLAEEPDSNGDSGIDIAQQIHKRHPELPIFLRRHNGSNLEDMEDRDRLLFAGGYNIEDVSILKKHISDFIFNTEFPGKFVQAIQNITMEAVETQLSGMEVLSETPYISKEYRTSGDLSSYTVIDSEWCKGYMLMQIMIDDVENLVRAGKTILSPTNEPGAREINSWLSEVTNMVWGGIKRDILSISVDESYQRPPDTAIPIILNARDGAISIGSSIPQIDFEYLLCDKNQQVQNVRLFQKLCFHVHWVPEAIAGANIDVQKLVDVGDITFF